MPETPICDFCSATPVQFAEEAADISVPLVGMLHGEIRDTGKLGRSTGAWASCAECHQLILGDKRESLVRRGARSVAEHEPNTKQLLAQGFLSYTDLNMTVRKMHAAFWSSRTGHFHLV